MLQKIAFGSVVIIFLVAPLLTHATSPVLCLDGQTAPNHADGRCPEWTDDYGTTSNLQAKIDNLIAQIRELQAQYEKLLKQPSTELTQPVDLSRIVCLRLDRAL